MQIYYNFLEYTRFLAKKNRLCLHKQYFSVKSLLFALQCGILSRFPSCILATFLSPLATLSINGQSYCHFVYYVRMIFGHPSFSIIPASYAVFVCSFSRINAGSLCSFSRINAGSLCPLFRHCMPAILASMPRAPLRDSSFFLCRRIKSADTKTRHSPECRASILLSVHF